MDDRSAEAPKAFTISKCISDLPSFESHLFESLISSLAPFPMDVFKKTIKLLRILNSIFKNCRHFQ